MSLQQNTVANEAQELHPVPNRKKKKKKLLTNINSKVENTMF